MQKTDNKYSSPSDQADQEAIRRPTEIKRQREIGGFKGLEPTRYGDWEKNGRCIDF